MMTTNNDARSPLVIIDRSSDVNAVITTASGKNRNSSPENERQFLLLRSLLILFIDNGVLVNTKSSG
jgi:PHD/YefM family antitoxin component YafN of YafNO toxin-antitoxin module